MGADRGAALKEQAISATDDESANRSLVRLFDLNNNPEQIFVVYAVDGAPFAHRRQDCSEILLMLLRYLLFPMSNLPHSCFPRPRPCSYLTTPLNI